MGRLHKLTQGRVNAAKTPGLYSDGGNLHLRVAAGGSRQWVFRYTLNHRTRDYGVGPYPTLSLAEARERAHVLRKLVLDKIDPIEHRNEQRATANVAAAKHMTFDAAAEAYIAAHEQSWRSRRHRNEWVSSLRADNGWPSATPLSTAARGSWPVCPELGEAIACLHPRDKNPDDVALTYRCLHDCVILGLSRRIGGTKSTMGLDPLIVDPKSLGSGRPNHFANLFSRNARLLFQIKCDIGNSSNCPRKDVPKHYAIKVREFCDVPAHFRRPQCRLLQPGPSTIPLNDPDIVIRVAPHIRGRFL